VGRFGHSSLTYLVSILLSVGRLRVARQNQLPLIDRRNPDVDLLVFEQPRVSTGGRLCQNFSLLFPIWGKIFHVYPPASEQPV
jgi:hypothetical protein